MSYYYPQAALSLRVLWENPDDKDPQLARPYNLHTLCKNVTVTINDYRQADTFRAELDYKCFPFDPRLIKGVSVSVHIEDMRGLYDEAGNEKRLEPSPSNIIFQGYADEESINLDESSRTVSFEGRDYTALLVDRPFPHGTIDINQDIGTIIQSLLSGSEVTEAIQVVNRTGGALPVLGKFYPERAGGKLTGKKNVKRGETYWDVIVDMANRAALIAYIELDKLVLAKPRNLYAGAKPYQFIYGKNINKLRFERKLSKQKGFNVLVRSLATEVARSDEPVIEAKIPEEATAEWAEAIGIPLKRATIKQPVAAGTGKDGGNFEEKEAPFMSFNIPNVRDKAQLIEIGQGIYEELSRQQIEGELETKEMCILQRDTPTSPEPVTFDIRKIRNATPIKITLAEDDMEQVKSISGDTPNAVGVREDYLIARGYPRQFAHALAVSLGRYPTTFYTKSVQFNLDQTNGFSMSLQFINFIDLKEYGR